MIAGIGTDLIELNRVEKVISRLTKRILTPNEQAALPEAPGRRLEFVAGRFAAKDSRIQSDGVRHWQNVFVSGYRSFKQ